MLIQPDPPIGGDGSLTRPSLTEGNYYHILLTETGEVRYNVSGENIEDPNTSSEGPWAANTLVQTIDLAEPAMVLEGPPVTQTETEYTVEITQGPNAGTRYRLPESQLDGTTFGYVTPYSIEDYVQWLNPSLDQAVPENRQYGFIKEVFSLGSEELSYNVKFYDSNYIQIGTGDNIPPDHLVDTYDYGSNDPNWTWSVGDYGHYTMTGGTYPSFHGSVIEITQVNLPAGSDSGNNETTYTVLVSDSNSGYNGQEITGVVIEDLVDIYGYGTPGVFDMWQWRSSDDNLQNVQIMSIQNG
jgi:hypothetical protein